MARVTRQVPNLYFGQPGRGLVTLPWPKSGLDKAYERQTFDFLTGSGLHQVSSLSQGSRSYSVNWDAMHVDTFNKLEPYRIGLNGPGPFVLIDPSAMNLFSPNVSSATGLLMMVNGEFIVNGGASPTNGTISCNVNSTYIHRSGGRASLRWTWTGTPVSFPVLRTRPPFRNWYGIPVAPGMPYTLSSWVRVDGVVETSATMSMKMTWIDAAGAQVSESTTADTAVTGWQRLSLTATPPAGAVYLDPRWVVVGSSLVTGGSIYIDEPMLEQDSVLNEWAAGTGVRAVEIVGLGETVPFETRFRTGTTMTLRELAA